MSALLVEVFSQSFPCEFPISSPFDKQLVVLSEDTVLTPHLRREYRQVQDCGEFVRSPTGNYFLRTSSEFLRGVIAGTLHAKYKLTVSTDRPDLYQQQFPNLSVYAPAQTTPSGINPELSVDVPSSSNDPSGGNLKKVCHDYLRKVLTKPKKRAQTLPQAKEQILNMMSHTSRKGKKFYARVFSTAQARQEVARQVLEAAVQEGYLRISDQVITYNDALCFQKPCVFFKPALANAAPPPASMPSSSPVAPEETKDPVDVGSDLKGHIAAIVSKVIAGRNLESMSEIMQSIQACFLEHEQESKRSFSESEVDQIVPTVISFLMENGYMATDYPS
jgi:hypothetical protein